ncbi:MAG: azurin [Planctomycetota bacterium]
MSHFVPLFLLLVAALPPLAAQTPPAGFESPDHDIKIGVRAGLLRYDTEKFSVGVGSKVKLTLVNSDEMVHNLLICRDDDYATSTVAAAAMMLGPNASKTHYVPDIPEVLFHTKAISTGQQDTIWFEAPKKPGAYPYICTLPGHTFTMIGVMRVGPVDEVKQKLPIEQLRYRLYKGQWKKLPVFDTLPPDREGELKNGVIDLAKLKEQSNFGACFTGVLEVKAAGRHTFFLNSDDGSRVLVGGKMIVEYDGQHGPAKEQKGDVELTAGRHLLRVEFFQGGGGKALRLAYSGPDKQRHDLSNNKNEIETKVTPISVHHHPVVMRVHIEGAAARTIAVGLQHGINYCFDADACSVQFGWGGAYLDVGPDRDGRGGRPCKVLGQRFEVGNVGFPLRTADGQKQATKFLGYGTHGTPRFTIDWGGSEVHWTIAAAHGGVGLQYTFALPSAREDVQFAIEAKGLKLSSSAGQWQGGVLTVPAVHAKSFTVTVMTATGGKK